MFSPLFLFITLTTLTSAVPTWEHWTSSPPAKTSTSTLTPSLNSTNTQTWHPSVHTSNPGHSGPKNNGAEGPALVSSPLGSVEVVNNCPFEVGSNIVHAPRKGRVGLPEEVRGVLKSVNVNGVKPGNGTWDSEFGTNGTATAGSRISHPFLHDPGLGVSWKLSRNDGSGPVQFEWTWVPSQERVYWDLSMIDAHANTKRQLTTPDLSNSTPVESVVGGIRQPFYPYGITVTPMLNGKSISQAQGGGNCVAVRCRPGEGICQDAYNTWDDWKAQRDCGEIISLRVVLCAA